MDRFVFRTKWERPRIVLFSFVYKPNIIALFPIVFAFDNVGFIFAYGLWQTNCKVKVFIYRRQLKKVLKENVMMILLEPCVNI